MEGLGHLLNIKKIGYIYKKPFSVIAIFFKSYYSRVCKKCRIYSYNLSVYEAHFDLNIRA